MVKNSLLIILCMLSMASTAQVVQRGKVLEQNSGKRAVSGVAFMVRGASPATSDQNGIFALNYRTARSGDPLVIVDIHKTGYEIVNSKELNTWNLSPSTELTVVVCVSGTLDAAKRHYYKLGEDIYRKKYMIALTELDNEKKKMAIDEAVYAKKLNEANQNLIIMLSNLEVLSDRFARVNKDALSDLDRRAMELFESGNVDGAIALYDEAKIVEKFNEQRLQRDSMNINIKMMRPSLEKEIETLLKSNKKEDIMRADSMTKILKNNE